MCKEINPNVPILCWSLPMIWLGGCRLSGGGRRIDTEYWCTCPQGVQFSQGYVSCSISGPSRAGILTGVYQQRFGFYNNLHPWVKDSRRAIYFGWNGSAIVATLRDLSENGIWLTLPNNLLIVGDLNQFYGFWSDTHDYYRSTDKPGVELYDFCLCIGMARFNPLCTKVVNILRTVLHVKLWSL